MLIRPVGALAIEGADKCFQGIIGFRLRCCSQELDSHNLGLLPGFLRLTDQSPVYVFGYIQG